MTRVKICGITNLDDALVAVDAGADALGFNFATGPRKVDPKTARRIIERLPPFVVVVGVFVGEDTSVARIADECGVQVIQLHGGESAHFADSLSPRPVVPVVHVKDAASLKAIASYQGASAILLDAKAPGMLGGTGRTFDWDLAVEAKRFGKPIILAGGLNPDNVADAVRAVDPYAVDAASGVESSPGRKDHELLRAFVGNAKGA